MAVYERLYQLYTGPETPRWSRFLVLPRYVYQDVFASRAFLSYYVACFVPTLLWGLAIYLPHNLRVLKVLQLDIAQLASVFRFDARFFGYFLVTQGWLSFFVALVVGPAVISRDLNNNGLPLYLARPFSRSEYVLGKGAVLILLLSAITWLPGLFLFFLQSYLAGWGWVREYWHVGPAIFLGSWIWILVLCLLSLAFSAYLKSRPVAGAALFGVFFIAAWVGSTINLVLGTKWGSVLNILEMVGVVWSRMLGTWAPSKVPPWAAWLSLLSLCGLCIWLLARKVRAYEVVRS